MDRRQFLALIAAILMLFGVRASSDAEARTEPTGIRYWVVVGDRNPFAFGVKTDSEVLSFNSVRPGRYRTAEAARAACVA